MTRLGRGDAKADGDVPRAEVVLDDHGHTRHSYAFTCDEWLWCDAKVWIEPSEADVARMAAAYFRTSPGDDTFELAVADLEVYVDGDLAAEDTVEAFAHRDASAPGGIVVTQTVDPDPAVKLEALHVTGGRDAEIEVVITKRQVSGFYGYGKGRFFTRAKWW